MQQAVDIERDVIQVRATPKPIDGALVIAETKTRRSRRRIAIPPSACEALRRYGTRQLEERLALRPAWQDLDLVFATTIGNAMDPRSWRRRWFRPLLRKADLPLIRPHDLRHSAATLLLLQGGHPKIVSEMLGHASVAITLDFYSHVLPDMQREATVAMEHLLGNDAMPGSASVGVRVGVNEH